MFLCLSVFFFFLWRLPPPTEHKLVGCLFRLPKSTQIENEQHPLLLQTGSTSAVGERAIFWDRDGITDPCDDTSSNQCLYVSELLSQKVIDKTYFPAFALLQLCQWCYGSLSIKHLAAHIYIYISIYMVQQPCCPCSPTRCGCFSLEFITAAQWGPESSSANEERWGEMKTLRAMSSGT